MFRIFLFVFIFVSAHAQNIKNSVKKEKSLSPVQKTGATEEKIFRVYTESQFYISPKSYPDQGSTYVHIGGELKASKTYRYWFYDIQAQIQASLDNSKQHYLSIPKGNVGFQLQDIQFISKLDFIKVSVGRYKKKWSWIDHHWQMGLWNPQNLYDYFRPIDLGIIGSALTLNGDQWSFISFASGVFLPNQQPAVQNNLKGKIKSQSRWQTLPPSRLNMFNRTIDAYYWLEEPNRKNVLFQSSYLTRLFFGDFNDRWVSFCYGYKPINQIPFRVHSGLSIEDTSAKSFIHYHPLKHHLSAVESGLRLSSWTIYFGIVDERVKTVKLPENWIVPPVPNAVFASVSISRNLDITSLNHNTVRFSYLTSWFKGTNKSSLMEGDLESHPVSLDRFKMNEGFSVDWESTVLYKGRKKISSLFRYWYSVDQKGGWLSWNLSYYFNSKSWIYFECNILGTDDKDQNGFFKKYANNDRVSVGGQYEF